MTTPDAAVFDRVAAARKSVRAFLPTPVPRQTVEDILRVAARAPSGNDIQPWRVHVLSGPTLRQVVKEACVAFDAADGSHTPEYDYYPSAFVEPYLSRRRNLGGDLYGLLGIARGDRQRMLAQTRRNFEFFGAPVGLMVTIDRRRAQGSWIDSGMFLQNILLAATARGLAICAQAAWIDYHRIIGRLLAFDDDEQLVCGIAMGHADPVALDVTLGSERARLEEFVRIHS